MKQKQHDQSSSWRNYNKKSMNFMLFFLLNPKGIKCLKAKAECPVQYHSRLQNLQPLDTGVKCCMVWSFSATFTV